jgi:hypothetical protein
VFVTSTHQRYLDDPVQREEGGTPAIIESIRAGLVFQLKEAVGTDAIRAQEESLIRRALASWGANPNIELLGNTRAERLSIVSFLVRHEGQFLHHNFVVAVLNDLFGIQSRGGCSCAGPYGMRLLRIDEERSALLEQEVSRGCEGIKPGWVRVNFNYFISEPVFNYIVEAVDLVATDGWRLLTDYRFDVRTGIWHHRDGPSDPPLRLTDVHIDPDGGISYPAAPDRAPESALAGYLEEARELLAARATRAQPSRPGIVSEDFEALRWFELPSECLR